MATVKVRVSSVDHTTVQSAAGKDLNYVVLKGYDETNSRGFKKQFFATKQDGTPTVHAQTADTLAPNDWVEIQMDDGKYQNVVALKKIGAPDGTAAPDQAEYKAAHPPRTSGGGAKKYRSVPQLNREVALDQTIKLIVAKAVKIKDMIEVACKLEDYLVNGIGMPKAENQSKTMPPPADPVGPDSGTNGVEDGIPF